MYNENLIPKYNDTILIESIILPKNKLVELNNLLMARLRVSGYGEIIVNQKNELVSGAEGLLLAIEKGEKVINVLRTEPISLKPRKKYGTY